jgi:hypothetical protein
LAPVAFLQDSAKYRGASPRMVAAHHSGGVFSKFIQSAVRPRAYRVSRRRIRACGGAHRALLVIVGHRLYNERNSQGKPQTIAPQPRGSVLEDNPDKVQAAGSGNIAKNKKLVDIPFQHRRKLNVRDPLQARSDRLTDQMTVTFLYCGYAIPHTLGANFQHFNFRVHRNGKTAYL